MAANPDVERLVCDDASDGESVPGRGAGSRRARKIAAGCAVATVLLGLILWCARDHRMGSDGLGHSFAPGDAVGLSGVPRRHSRAFSVLLYGDDMTALVNFRVLVDTLRRAAHRADGRLDSDLVAMIPQGDHMLKYSHLLAADGVRVVVVQRISLPKSMQSKEAVEKWSLVMDKLYAWTLTEYETVAQVDTDVFFPPGRGDPEELFDNCGDADACMAVDGDATPLDHGLEMNAGVIVLKPSRHRFHELVAAVGHEKHSYQFPEQGFLSDFLQDPDRGIAFTRLTPRWNSCSKNGLWTHSTLVHMCGPHKPVFHRIPRKDSDVSLRWLHWYQRLHEVDSCTAVLSGERCAVRDGCNWCENNAGYCMDSRLACSPGLFAKGH